jgi:hypothetical protein
MKQVCFSAVVFLAVNVAGAANAAEMAATAVTAPAAVTAAPAAKWYDRVKVGGFVQVRYEALESAWNGIDDRAEGGFKHGSGAFGKPDTFYLRNARLKVAAKPTAQSDAVVALNAASTGLSVKDAYLQIAEPWLGVFKLRAGQFYYPYGYDIERPDEVRDLPERTRWTDTVFAGSRDRGLALYANWRVVRFAGAVMNGNGTADKDERWRGADDNFAKDWVGRAGVEIDKLLQVGMSGRDGQKILVGKPADKATGAPPVRNRQYRTAAAGAYLQFTPQVPKLGEFALRGEYNRGWSEVWADAYGKPRDDERRVRLLGWHVQVSQYVFAQNQLVFRVDAFDPDLAARDPACNTAAHFLTSYCHFSRVTTWVAAWNFFWDESVRFTTAVTVPRQPGWADKRDRLFTEQFQIAF